MTRHDAGEGHMPDMERALEALAQQDRASVSPAFEDRVFAASRAGLRGRKRQTPDALLSPWRRMIALAAMLAVAAGVVVTLPLLKQTAPPLQAQGLSLDEELDLWFEASHSAAATIEWSSLRTELDDLERSLDRPWPASGVILEEDMM